MTSATTTVARLCPEPVRAANRRLDVSLRRHHMDLARWKVVKTTLLSLAILGFGAFAILQGADPTLTATVAIPIVGLIAGFEFSELVAAMADTDPGE